MLSKAGFEIIELDTHADEIGEVVDIDVLFRKPASKCGRFEEQKKMDIVTIKESISPNDVVTIWGAGTKAHKYIELFDSSINIQHIVDKSASKQESILVN